MSNGTQMASDWGTLDPMQMQSYYAQHGYDTSKPGGYSFGQGGTAPPLLSGWSPYSAAQGGTGGGTSGGIGGGQVVSGGGQADPNAVNPNAATAADSADLPPWLKALSMGAAAYGKYSEIPSYDPSAMQQQINPLEESYQNLQDLSQEYADPNSALNQQARREIRTHNMEGFADIADRQRKIATGQYGDTSGGVANTQMMTDAISAALKNYSSQHGERMKTSAELQYKAGSIGNILAQARQSNYYNQRQQKAKQRGMIGEIAGDIASYGWDWLTGGKKV